MSAHRSNICMSTWCLPQMFVTMVQPQTYHNTFNHAFPSMGWNIKCTTNALTLMTITSTDYTNVFFYMSTIKQSQHIHLYIIHLSTALVYPRWIFLFVYTDNNYCLYHLYWPHHVDKCVAMATLWQASNKTNECFIVCGRLLTIMKEPRDIPHQEYR